MKAFIKVLSEHRLLVKIALVISAVVCCASQASADEAAAVNAILSQGGGQWEAVAIKKDVLSAVPSEIEGRPVLTSRGRHATLTCANVPQATSEIKLVFRFTGKEANEGGALRLLLGEKMPDAKEPPVRISATWRPDRGHLGWFLWLPEMSRPLRGNITADGIGPRSLNWDEDFRRIIEAEQVKLKGFDEQWVTMRLQILDGRLRLYISDQLLTEQTIDPAKLNLIAPATVQVLPHTALAYLSAEPIDQPPAGYEPLPLRSHLNARQIGKTKLKDNALHSSADKPLIVNGVPFDVPARDEDGNDHIDLGNSWVPGARLSGRSSTRGRTIIGRWAGAPAKDPMRVQMAIPTARYRAVHLLAAADGDTDELPIVTAQFYRNQRGFPQNFTTKQPVPEFFDSRATGIKVATADGKTAQLHHITIPVAPGKLAAFEGVTDLELELTKQVEIYRAYPDPMYYSWHGAGLPSSVRVFAVTLEKPDVEMSVTPGAFADTWTAPDSPNYNIKLTNHTEAARKVLLSIRTKSYFSDQTTEQKQTVTVPANGDKTINIKIQPPCHGYHDLTVQMNDSNQLWNEERGLVYLHEDTRERGDWQPGRGPIFGFWNWRGGHNTPTGVQQTDLMGRAGAESSSGSFESQGARHTDEERAAARKWGMITFKAFGGGDHYITARFAGTLKSEGMEKAKTQFIEQMKKAKTAESDINRPELISFFPEPHIGVLSYGTPPQYYGDPPLEMNSDEEAKFQMFLKGFVEGAKILKEHYPNVKAMLPHGDPTFPIPFVTRSKEARELFDGISVDIPVFERMPEQQIHQVSLHRMYFCRDGLNKVGITNPTLAMYEGPSRSAYIGALSDQQLADFSVRDSLILYAYGVDRQTGGWAPFESGSYWGEQHYGGGICHRLPRGTPRPAYAAFGTMTRHLNRKNYTGWLPTGSLSTYAMQFTHYKTNKKMHVFWIIRGKRPITLNVADGAKVAVYDLMDNKIEPPVNNGKVTFTLSSSPVWVYGLTGNEKITLGDPDHRDVAPAKDAVKLASVGDGTWRQSTERDEAYEDSFISWVKRFPGKMKVTQANAPAKAGGKALAVKLDPKQDRMQKIMPYYTTLEPAKPITIKGKGTYLGLWVKGSDDWGRMIYSVRDAKGERWISVGKAGAWNCDDIMNWSAFAFNGWRYLRFELPANTPWDSYREPGTVWWGSYSKGDGIIDLPLKLEKIIIERRSHAMYVTDPQPAHGHDALIGDLYVEYEDETDMSDETVRLSRIRMAVPKDVPDLGNPITKLAEAGTLTPTKITHITTPEHHADGTRCHVHFDVAADAVTYDVWASPYKDGRGAIKLGKKWKESGQMIRGLRPDTKFYLFAVFTDKDGNTSKPSSAFEIELKDMFGMK